MSKSVLTTLLGVALSWMVVSCAANGVKPADASSAMTATTPAAPPPAVAAVSPWQGAGIFFYPFLGICVVFGIAMYASGSKST